jgi:hypothetical protein
MPALPPYINRSPSGSSSVPCRPKEVAIILWVDTVLASATGWSSRSWFRASSSAVTMGAVAKRLRQ